MQEQLENGCAKKSMLCNQARNANLTLQIKGRSDFFSEAHDVHYRKLILALATIFFYGFSIIRI